MNELLLRQAIFHPVTGEFLEWHYWGLIDKAFVGVDTGWVSPTKAVENSQRFTGLTDKKEIRIYEGDITSEGIVEWCECLSWDSGGSEHPGFYFKDKYDCGERGELDYHIGFDEDIEIIGNIYENPELLT